MTNDNMVVWLTAFGLASALLSATGVSAEVKRVGARRMASHAVRELRRAAATSGSERPSGTRLAENIAMTVFQGGNRGHGGEAAA